jgi:plasmid stability protein
MSQIVLQDLDPTLLEILKTRASRHGRSLEAELTTILQAAAAAEIADRVKQMATFSKQAAQMRQTLAQRVHTDSVELICEDRNR